MERVAAQLRREEAQVNLKRVQRVMREPDLLVRRQRGAKTTQSDRPFGCYLNLLHELEIARPDQGWRGDITYVHL